MKSNLKLLYLVIVFLFLASVSDCKTSKANESFTAVARNPMIDKLPEFRGFNLLNMFIKGTSDDRNFSEKDFQTISEWGFNFVRIPVDYRILIRGNDWNVINDNSMARLDKAVEFGVKYNIHVCINLHRAPGFTVASPPETTDLWTQKEPQEAFARLWGILAERYKDIPAESLSFNLINEPPNIEEEDYAAVMKKAAGSIWAKDPKRLIIADGREYGSRPSGMIKELGMAQATRAYYPNTITHYKAEWIGGSFNYPLPVWPSATASKYLYSSTKTDVQRSMYSIGFDFKEAYYLDINIGTVSQEARLVVKADEKVIYEKLFASGPGEGEWTKSVHNQQWNIYQNIYDKDYRVSVPSGTRLITLEVTDGDWMTVNDMKFSPAARGGSGKAFSFTPNSMEWGKKIPAVQFDSSGSLVSTNASRSWLWDADFSQWENYITDGGLLIGEWGAYNKTPHDVTLKWMEDNLINFKEHGVGWALWNFTGSFGPLNSGRADVEYEDYNGYKLDRKMLELLQKYL